MKNYKSLRKIHSNRKMGKRFDTQFIKESIQFSVDILVIRECKLNTITHSPEWQKIKETLTIPHVGKCEAMWNSHTFVVGTDILLFG